jgi:hypothetical protein
MKYWEIIADNLRQSRVGVGAVSQPWILRDGQSGLLMRTATTESVSLCAPMKKLTAFLELKSAIRASGEQLAPALG